MTTADIFTLLKPMDERRKSKSLKPMHADRAVFRIFAHESAISRILA